ncbi:Cytochrome c-type biogenesis protein CcmE [bacterium HR12]|nr:Cytochrome c-type biogenesis protein CcmE [bacterium HR12]
MTTVTDADGFPELDAPEGFVRRPSRLPLVLLGIAVLGALVAVGYTMFTRSVVYYHTPTEVRSMPGERVRISGQVVDGSISTDPSAGVVRFAVTDGVTTVPVVYRGPRPDTLRDEAEAVVEGELGRDGVFRADVLFAKCPSKFEAKLDQGG